MCLSSERTALFFVPFRPSAVKIEMPYRTIPQSLRDSSLYTREPLGAPAPVEPSFHSALNDHFSGVFQLLHKNARLCREPLYGLNMKRQIFVPPLSPVPYNRDNIRREGCPWEIGNG